MIFSDIQTAVVARLLNDAYFTEAVPIPVLAEGNRAIVVSGSIETARVYRVKSGTITYNAVARSEGETFIGTTTTTFTGSGVVCWDETERNIASLLDSVGICAVVSKVRDASQGEGRYNCKIPIFVEVYENSMLNQKPTGTSKPPDDVCMKIWALLIGAHGEDEWAPSYFTPLEFTSMSEVYSEGVDSVWRISFDTGTFVSRVTTLLADQSGAFITNDQGNPIIYTPTPA